MRNNPTAKTLRAREQVRARLADLRRRHAALAARLLAAPAPEAEALLSRARANVERWERERLCSAHFISRWRAKLAGSVHRSAMALLKEDDRTDALLQNTPWGFALGSPAAWSVLADVPRVLRPTPEDRLREVANASRFIAAARRLPPRKHGKK